MFFWLLFCYSEVGNEAVLNTLWERHEKAADKVCLEVSYFLNASIQNS
jgi:hypothetical protein